MKKASVALLVVSLASSGAAWAQQYFTPTAVLKSFFASSKKIGPKHVTLSDTAASAIAKKLGVSSISKEWDVYEAKTEENVDGFALLDAEKGMHEPIDFAVKFTTKGAVERVEVREYREPYGDEIRGERFRAQFKGKTASDPLTVGKDIDLVSGASISSKSMALGVKRDALVVQAAIEAGALP